MNYETRTLKIAIVPEGEPIFSERATEIEIVDNAAGEYLKITQNSDDTPDPESGNQTLTIDPAEWPHIQAAIEKMLKECRNHN